MVAGVALGCALATKLTALFFLPVIALLGLATERVAVAREAEAPASRFGRARRWLLRRRRLELALVLLTGFFTLWLWHGFDFEFHDLTSLQERYNGPPPPEWLGWLPVPLPFPNYFEGLNWQIGHARTGHSNYLLGEVASTGWWYFFFVAVALKVPHGFQLATLIAAGRAVRFHARDWAITGLLLTFPLLFFVYMSFFSTVQNGIKYLLPALPLTYVWTVWVVGKLGRRWKAIAVALLLLGCVESLRVHPDYLMFFNAAAGGPDGGWRYLVHGDDWGQDQNAVGVWQREHDLPLIDFAFYSPKPEKWGIKSRQPTCGPKVGVLVVHVVELVRPDWSPAGCYEWLKGRRPDEKLHYSIFIYRITRDEVLALRAGEAKGSGRLSKWGDPDYVW
ncbi:MAG: hypothetical protein H6730_09215 [Deltaproteobacteria bacterium]|nr:hypothetical protein [Deltaproteobacteria bacterium]